jgi:hypothetical protein
MGARNRVGIGGCRTGPPDSGRFFLISLNTSII